MKVFLGVAVVAGMAFSAEAPAADLETDHPERRACTSAVFAVGGTERPDYVVTPLGTTADDLRRLFTKRPADCNAIADKGWTLWHRYALGWAVPADCVRTKVEFTGLWQVPCR